MVLDLASTGFAFAAEWYWRIVEDDGTFGAAAARACLLPLARLAHGSFTIDEITASADDRVVDFRLQGTPVTLGVGLRNPRASADRFVIDLNRELRTVDHAFALVVPRRYELRGVLLPRPALADHAYNRFVLAPSDRTGWHRLARGTPEL